MTGARLEEPDGEPTNETVLRWRVRLVDHRQLAVLVVVALLCVGGWLSYTAYVDPGERRETRQTESWSMTGTFSHGATVVEPNPIYDTGSELRDEPVYYTRLSPTAVGTVTAGYEASSGENVTTRLEVDLVARSVDGDVVYWEQREQLATRERTAVDPGEEVVADFEVNVSRLESRLEEIDRRLGARPGDVETVVDVTTTVDGTIDGQQRTATRRRQIDLTHDGATYAFDADPFEEPISATEAVTVTRSYGPVWTVGGLLLVAAALVGGGLLIVASYHEPSALERAWLAYRDDRAEFAELIVRAELPAAMADRPRVDVQTLGELARVAIQTDAVILARTAHGNSHYVVCEGDVLYVYEPPAPPSAEVAEPVGDVPEMQKSLPRGPVDE
ncbi:DUF5305 domain-containing protein [Natribaculum luteum]|uniref:DUF5305 domain-containing protein n=1 Tax=Natribaculum luteum TaxID=1586232 RepID=A0ABD5P166_9EURY|nr:DUF5305 domain-containing protein [Natribaculum luteum]